jgi:hypothetical protein
MYCLSITSCDMSFFLGLPLTSSQVPLFPLVVFQVSPICEGGISVTLAADEMEAFRRVEGFPPQT